jgi:hypothetical protein
MSEDFRQEVFQRLVPPRFRSPLSLRAVAPPFVVRAAGVR